MIRELETVQGKPVELLLTSAVVKKGAPVDVDSEDQTVKATAEGLGTKLCDVNAKYEGIYSIVEPTDGEFEEATAGERVRVIQTLPGEMYATSELDTDTLQAGDKLQAKDGKFVKATAGQYAYEYRGIYSDPTGIKMGKIARVEVSTVA